MRGIRRDFNKVELKGHHPAKGEDDNRQVYDAAFNTGDILRLPGEIVPVERPDPEHQENKIKRQASVLVLRIETPSYWASLGVWVVRESVRKALSYRKLEFDSLNEILESSRKVSMIKFGFDNSKILGKSKLLESIKTQTTLGKWF